MKKRKNRTKKEKTKFLYNSYNNSIVLIFLIVFFLITNGIKPSASQYSYDELSIPILTYHKFCEGESTDDYTINIDHFKLQMEFLKQNGYKVISVSRLLECIENNFFPEKPVVITIDDGFKSVYSLAFPVLREYNFPANLYLYTDFIGNGPNQLKWSEIKEMMSGGIEIGSHTLSHANLLTQKANESYLDYLNRIKKEIFLSKTILETNTESPVLSFAYPYGVYSQEIRMLAKQAGYKGLLNVNNMNNSIPIDPYSLNRQIIPSNGSIRQFQAIVQEKTLRVSDIFPPDGTITENQEITVGAILDSLKIEPTSLYFRLSGSGSINHTYCPEQQKISFTPIAPKLLQKRTWIALITARDSETGQQRKVSWLFTVR